MSEVAVAVRDPRGKKHAQLLHDDLAVREVTLILADRLGMPTKLNYELIDLATNKALDARKTLRGLGIAAGADLQLVPVRDKIFDAFVKALKDEIKDELRDKALDEAKEVLAKLDADSEVAGSAGAGGQATSEAGSGDTAVQSEAEPKAKSSSCLRTGCIGVIVIALLAAAAAFVLYDDYIKPVVAELLPGLVRPAEPVLGTGDVQVTLRWDNPVDLDLHVIDPSGEEIYFSHSTSQSGGTLDVDANAGCGNDAPVENIYWPSGGAPFGTYQVSVVYFNDCGYSGANAYTISILVDGQRFGPYEGLLTAEGEGNYVTSFSR